MEKGGASFFYHADGLGSITEITDSTGVVKQSYTYSSFGKIESQLDPNFIQPYTFTAREFDPETGLYFYRARYYDPSTGGFLQVDPRPGLLFLPQTLNRYPYTVNNPVVLTDPSGQNPLLLAAGLVAGQLAIETAIFYGITGDLPSALLATGALQAVQLGTLGVLSGLITTGVGLTVGSPIVVGFGIAQTAVSANIVYQGIEALRTILSRGRDLDDRDFREILLGRRQGPSPPRSPGASALECK